MRGIITLANISFQEGLHDISKLDSRGTAVDNHVGSRHVAAEATRQEAGDPSNLRWRAGTLEADVFFL